MTERHFKKCIQETDTDKLKAIREEWMNLILFAHSQPLDRRAEKALRKMCKLSTAIEEELTKKRLPDLSKERLKMEKNIFLSSLELVKIAGVLSTDIGASKKAIENTKKKNLPYEYLVDSVNSTEKLLKKIESLL